ncbi:LysR family transcriptional regulator [Paraburkholderia strydomiana]
MSVFDERVLNGMSVFIAVVDAGSFAGAAEQLDMSQPGVSRAIARLEARLGVRLFDRTTRAVSLTDEGGRFYDQIIPLLSGLERAASTISSSATSVRGRLRVNIDPFFSRLVLGPRLEAFLKAHPDLTLELTTRDQLGDLVVDGFDLAVRFGEPRVSALRVRKLLETRILTVAAPSYLSQRGRPFKPQELGDGGHTCIEFRDPDTGRPFQWEFHGNGQRIHVETSGKLILNDVGTMLSTCVAGYGIAQVMQLSAEQLLAEGKLIDLFPDWPDERFPLYALYLSGSHPPAKTRAFLDFVVSLTDSSAQLPKTSPV